MFASNLEPSTSLKKFKKLRLDYLLLQSNQLSHYEIVTNNIFVNVSQLFHVNL